MSKENSKPDDKLRDEIKGILEKEITALEGKEGNEKKIQILKDLLDDLEKGHDWKEKIKFFLNTVLRKMNQGIDDMTNLDVTTMIGNVVELDEEGMKKAFAKDFDFSQLKGKLEVVGVTRLDADGDIQELLYGTQGKLLLSPTLLKVHNDNVSIGVETWNRYWRNLLLVASTVAAIVDPKDTRAKLVEALRTELEPLGKAPKDEEDSG